MDDNLEAVKCIHILCSFKHSTETICHKDEYKQRERVFCFWTSLAGCFFSNLPISENLYFG